VNPPSVEGGQQPIARLRLRKVPVLATRERAPVFHVFEELYARAVRQLRGGARELVDDPS
jgi:hypothetical protein